MPARAPKQSALSAQRLAELGDQIRAVRKGLGVSLTTTAEAAGMSRVTLYRIERGQPSVTMGAYLAVMSALGLELSLATPDREHAAKAGAHALIRVEDFPELHRIMWHLPGVNEITRHEAFDIYERNWKHVDKNAMTDKECQLVAELARAYGGGRLLV